MHERLIGNAADSKGVRNDSDGGTLNAGRESKTPSRCVSHRGEVQTYIAGMARYYKCRSTVRASSVIGPYI